jgi:hypothetical protein
MSPVGRRTVGGRSGADERRCSGESGPDDHGLGDGFVGCAIDLQRQLLSPQTEQQWDSETCASIHSSSGRPAIQIRLDSAGDCSKVSWSRAIVSSVGSMFRGRSASVKVATARSIADWVEPHRGQVSPRRTSRCQTMGIVTGLVAAASGLHDWSHPHCVPLDMVDIGDHLPRARYACFSLSLWSISGSGAGRGERRNCSQR